MRKLRKETDGQDREDSSEGTSLRSTQGFPGPGSPGQMPEVLESYGMLCDGCVRNGELGGAGNKADCFGPCEPCCGSWPFSFGGSKEPAEGLTTGQ